MARRSPGTGSLSVRRDTAGRETYYGKWTTPGGRQVKRRLGPRRVTGTHDGLTLRQAEAELRRLMTVTESRGPRESDSRSPSSRSGISAILCGRPASRRR